MSGSEELAVLDPELQDALAAYRVKCSDATWTALAQLYCGLVQVVDAVKVEDPTFPDPYPLAAADLATSSDDFFQWPVLPAYDLVVRAVVAAQKRR
jgi:hypothetical protein